MRTLLCGLLAILIMFVIPVWTASACTVEQKLLLMQNDKTLGGSFKVAVQVKSTELYEANTLFSATIDITYDNGKLTFVDGTTWAFGSAQGYSQSVTDNGSVIRVEVSPAPGAGPGSDAYGPGDPTGFDIGETYMTWVILNFTISSTSSPTSLSIVSGGESGILLYEHHGNIPATSIARNDVTISPPTGIDGEALPVQLSSFTVSVIQQNSVQLSWTTVSEVNNYGFTVQRRSAMETMYVDAPNGFLAGHGTSTDMHEYRYVDLTAGAGVWFYRLKQTDLDGTVHFSDGESENGATAVTIKPLPTAFALEQNYPNPFNPSTTIEFAFPQETHLELAVYSVLGQYVKTLVSEVRKAGNYAERFDASSLASGVYVYRIQAGNFVAVKRFMLLK